MKGANDYGFTEEEWNSLGEEERQNTINNAFKKGAYYGDNCYHLDRNGNFSPCIGCYNGRHVHQCNKQKSPPKCGSYLNWIDECNKKDIEFYEQLKDKEKESE